jgi:hypothetical protein
MGKWSGKIAPDRPRNLGGTADEKQCAPDTALARTRNYEEKSITEPTRV